MKIFICTVTLAVDLSNLHMRLKQQKECFITRFKIGSDCRDLILNLFKNEPFMSLLAKTF